MLLPFAQAASMVVSAVDLDRQGLLAVVDVQAKPGTGQVFLNVSGSLIDSDTQSSIRVALKRAAFFADKDLNDFDFSVGIIASAERINGPSAGAAFAVLAFSELTRQGIRRDFSITGTLEEDGSIGSVGGVKNKVDALGNLSKVRVVAVPVGQAVPSAIGVFEESDLVSYAADAWGIQVVEVANFSQALQVAFSSQGGAAPVFSRPSLSSLIGSFNASEKSGPLREMALNTLNDVEKVLGDFEYSQVVESSASRSLSASRMLVERGYYYSGANAGFVVKNSLDSIVLRNSTPSELNRMARVLLSQAQSMDFKDKNSLNWEWVVGAQLRNFWALEKLEEVVFILNSSNSSDSDLSVLVAYDLASAGNWIAASKRMNKVAKSLNGSVVSDKDFESYARALFDGVSEDFNESGLFDSEVAWHLKIASRELEEEAFLASVFSSYFARSYLKARLEVAKTSSELQTEDLVSYASSVAPTLWNSMWAESYFAHSFYSEAERQRLNDAYYLLNALKLKELAFALEVNHGFVSSGNWSLPVPLNESVDALVVPSQENSGVPFCIAIPTPLSTALPFSKGNASQDLVTQVEVTPSQSQLPLWFFWGVLFLLVVFIVVFLWRLGVSKRQSDEEKLQRLDGLVLDGHLSAKSYEYLKAKYFPPKKRVRKKKGKAKRSRKKRV
ncbi:MAG: S16 family serine protease [Candidatus Micrarchaeia archaeon]